MLYEQIERLVVAVENLVIETRKVREVSEKHLEYFKKYHCPAENEAQNTSTPKIQPERESKNVVEEELNPPCNCAHDRSEHGSGGCYCKVINPLTHNLDYCNCMHREEQ